jgi:transcriptional regulator with XRE-family HTH domain
LLHRSKRAPQPEWRWYCSISGENCGFLRKSKLNRAAFDPSASSHFGGGRTVSGFIRSIQFRMTHVIPLIPSILPMCGYIRGESLTHLFGSRRKDGKSGMNKSAAKKMKQRSAGKPDIELGKRIRLRRVEQRISQAELGEQLGVSFQQVQKYEKGVNRVGAARLQQIATALDVPVTFFYDGDGKAREVESLLFLDSSFSLRLLRAYSKIKDQTVQRQLVSLMESIAANED